MEDLLRVFKTIFSYVAVGVTVFASFIGVAFAVDWLLKLFPLFQLLSCAGVLIVMIIVITAIKDKWQ